MKSNKTLLQCVRLCLIVAFQFAISLQFTFAQSDVSVGTSYNLNIQRPNSFGDAFLLHNASFSASEDVLQWATSHPSFGSRGIRFAYGADKGIFFYASESSTTAGSTFQPTPRFFIGNHGRVGVNTVKPKANLEVNGGFLSGNTLASPNLYDHTIVRADANVAFEGGQIFINSETLTANGFKFSVAGSSNPSPLFRIGVVNAASPNQ